MSLSHSLQKRACPVCESTDSSKVMFKSNIDESALNQLSYASRKIPEFMSFTLACCPTCDLLYAPAIPNKEFLKSAYHSTGYDSNEEAKFAAKSYAQSLRQIKLNDRDAALEIGAGNGAFLEELLAAGFKEVVGIEPSLEAISAATPAIQKHIRPGMFNVSDFQANHFSLITIFQTLEHVDQPAQIFRDALSLLKPGGVLMVVAHNYRHWLMRLLGRKSPIIDIEHLQLFSPKSLAYALNKTGFKQMQARALRNSYPLHYWVKLMPIPRKLKDSVLTFLKTGAGKALGAYPIAVKVGNMVAWVQK